ncbi:riboflavin biosynthesis pyrimidine reductase [Salinibacterium sp. CAN_S4]|uniref:pyrimidine reductase family protein n=1 Tax=Salinibacterium sp. CAN_S4 TaxID=2787727 RepID=UPI0018EF90AE
MTARIDRLWPDAADNLSDDDLIAALATPSPTVRLNFVSSADGSSTHDGLSGGLSGPADKRHFELLRRVSDVVLVGAGTVRSEGYGPMLVSDASARWRVRHGMPEHPVFAIVSGSLQLDPRSRIFSEAPVRPIVVTSARASGLAEIAAVADVVIAGEEHVDLGEALRVIRERGHQQVLCEGGPSLFGSLIADGLVDELCLTVEPTLEAGDGPRISRGPTDQAQGMRLGHVLRSGDTLLLRYVR